MRRVVSIPRFQIADEAILALWDEVANGLNLRIVSDPIADGVLEATRHYFFGVLHSFPERVLSGVTVAADGTPPTLGLAISDTFKRHFVVTTEDLRKCLGH